eukprot:ctg_7644.g868
MRAASCETPRGRSARPAPAPRRGWLGAIGAARRRSSSAYSVVPRALPPAWRRSRHTADSRSVPGSACSDLPRRCSRQPDDHSCRALRARS